ncbi:HNH endonuclease [Arthrobacter sp. HLT1-20]
MSASPQSPGAAATNRCHAMLAMGAAVLESCGNFFDPVVLAQLDAALADELSGQERGKVEAAAAAVEAAIEEGRSADALAHLSQRVATARAAATKAESRAGLAAGVLVSLGGSVDPAALDTRTVDQMSGAVLIDVIAVLEETKNALAATQAHAQALFVAQQRLEQARAGVPRERLGRGIAHQLALARHESPHRGRQLCELSEVLVREMPYSMRAFSQGRISEYKAGLIAKETVFLSLMDRAHVDQSICGDPDAAGHMGNRELSATARKAAYSLDPQAFVKRHEKAVGDRYVSLRPAADGMTYLTALIPLKQGVHILTTLTKVADSLRASGDERGKGQIMADALMHRLVQHAPCNDGAGTLGDHRGVPVGGFPKVEGGRQPSAPLAGTPGQALCTTVEEASISLELVMTDRSLFGSANDPAVLVGYDPIPAPIARSMVSGSGSGSPSPQVWLKRLFTHPETNQLLAMDSHARFFPEGMKEFLRLQDQRCQTPYCDAPIREYDHIKAYAAGGATSMDNGQGLCSDCNQAKEAPGWSSTRSGDNTAAGEGPPVTEIETPTGHRYISTAPPLPGPPGHRSKHRR